MKLKASGSITGSILLEWDQTTDSPIVSVGTGYTELDFSCFGGISNPGATGATGDIVLTSRQLANLDEITIILEIKQD